MRFPCGHGNPDDNLFCDACGSKRAAPCPACHALNRNSAKFCGKCGFRLAESTAVTAESATATQADLPIGATPDPSSPRTRLNESTAHWTSSRAAPSERYAMATEPSRASARLNGDPETDSRRSRRGNRLELDSGETLKDNEEAQEDLRLERFVTERMETRQRQRSGRALLWGVIAAAALGFLIAAVVVGSGRGRQGATGAQRGDGQPPEAAIKAPPEAPSQKAPSDAPSQKAPPDASNAPAATPSTPPGSAANRPDLSQPPPAASSAQPGPAPSPSGPSTPSSNPSETGRPSVTDRGTAASAPDRPDTPATRDRSDTPASRGTASEPSVTLPDRSELPSARSRRSTVPGGTAPGSEPPAASARRPEPSDRAGDPRGPRQEPAGPSDSASRSEARPDSAGIMAENLIARHGPDQAEKTALANASWYDPGSPNHSYWQRVADAIRKAPTR
jgi:Double zinc ribbon